MGLCASKPTNQQHHHPSASNAAKHRSQAQKNFRNKTKHLQKPTTHQHAHARDPTTPTPTPIHAKVDAFDLTNTLLGEAVPALRYYVGVALLGIDKHLDGIPIGFHSQIKEHTHPYELTVSLVNDDNEDEEEPLLANDACEELVVELSQGKILYIQKANCKHVSCAPKATEPSGSEPSGSEPSTSADSMAFNPFHGKVKKFAEQRIERIKALKRETIQMLPHQGRFGLCPGFTTDLEDCRLALELCLDFKIKLGPMVKIELNPKWKLLPSAKFTVSEIRFKLHVQFAVSKDFFTIKILSDPILDWDLNATIGGIPIVDIIDQEALSWSIEQALGKLSEIRIRRRPRIARAIADQQQVLNETNNYFEFSPSELQSTRTRGALGRTLQAKTGPISAQRTGCMPCIGV